MVRVRRRSLFTFVLLLLAIGAFVVFRQNSSRAMDSPAVLAQVRQLNQLVTVRYTLQKVVGLREQKQPVGEESILLVMQATVTAGIDLAGLQPDAIVVHRDGDVTVRLPPPQILQVAVDEKETKVWDRQKTWWTPWIPYSPDLEGRARIAGLEAVKQGALTMGILREAERNAETSLRGLLGLAGFRSVQIVPARIS